MNKTRDEIIDSLDPYSWAVLVCEGGDLRPDEGEKVPVLLVRYSSRRDRKHYDEEYAIRRYLRAQLEYNLAVVFDFDTREPDYRSKRADDLSLKDLTKARSEWSDAISAMQRYFPAWDKYYSRSHWLLRCLGDIQNGTKRQFGADWYILNEDRLDS